MSERALRRVLVVLLVVAGLGVTAAVALAAIVRQRVAAPGAGGFPLPVGEGPSATGRTASPPVYGQLPAFILTERSGEPYGLEQLLGHAWIANFVYSRCPGPCPMMTAQMASLQRDLAGHPRWTDLRLVSFSVDPERDTPERLREYARLAKADPERWLFFTGEREKLWALTREGFKLAVAANEGPAAATQPVVHSQKFVLVDPRGRIRGYYDGLDPESRQRLGDDLERVLAEFPHDHEPRPRGP